MKSAPLALTVLGVSLLSLSAWVVSAPAALADDEAMCATGKTLDDGILTIATGNPTFYPWAIDNAPESGEGFEPAVAYAIAEQMGFAAGQVRWVRTSFDQAIRPGAKNFDVNMQQYSITPEREAMVDFSLPYYTSAMAVLTTQGAVDAGLEPTVGSLRGIIWGAHAGTTAMPMLNEMIAPERDPLLYGDSIDVAAALQADQIDAALFDLPTALYLAAVAVNDGVVIGQFPASRSQNPDQFGILLEQGNPLKQCVDAAITQLSESGALAEIEARWLQQATGVPVIE